MAKDKKPQRPSVSEPKLNNAPAKSTRTEQRQQVRQSEQRRQRITIAGISIGVFVLLAAIALIAGNLPADAPIPETASRYDGITQSMTEKGYPRLGADGVSVSLFSAFGCDECNTFHKDVLPLLVDRVRDGDISLTYIPLRAGTVSNFNGATRSALCAGVQGKFFPYSDALVAWTEAYGNGAFADNRLTTGANNLGLDGGKFGDCRRSAPENTVFDQALTDLGGRETLLVPPVVFVNGVIVNNAEGASSTDIVDINAAIDSALDLRSGSNNGSPTPEPTAELTPEPTAEPTGAATAEPTAVAETPTVEPTQTEAVEPTADIETPTVEPTATGG